MSKCGNCKYFSIGLFSSYGHCENHERKMTRNTKFIRQRGTKGCSYFKKKEELK